MRKRVVRKEIITGFGHPVYTASDPRNQVIKAVARRLSEANADLHRIGIAVQYQTSRFARFVMADILAQLRAE